MYSYYGREGGECEHDLSDDSLLNMKNDHLRTSMSMLPVPIFQLGFELIPRSNNGMALSMIS